MRNNILLISLLISLFFSCRSETDRNIQIAKDYMLITNKLLSVVPHVIYSSQDSIVLKSLLQSHIDTNNTCATYNLISGDTLSMLDSIVYNIDFGFGCSDSDQVYKAGIITCAIDSYLNNINGNCNVEFDGLQVDGYFLWGGIEISAITSSSYEIITKNLRLQSGKDIIVFQDTLVCNIQNGIVTTNYMLDDEYLISSIGMLIDRDNYVGNGISNDLYKKASCSWISAGIIEIETDESKKYVVNCGDNYCDNEAVIELNGENYIIAMP